MVQVIQRVAEHYDIQEVAEFARVYRWRPEMVVVECECGKRLTLKRKDITSASVAVCECGKDSTAGIREELAAQLLEEEDDIARHPWRYWHPSEHTGIPC